MAGNSINGSSTLQCPHGGQVQIVSSNVRVDANGMPLATGGDVYTVVGCPNQIPAVVPIPAPCLQVVWQVPDSKVRVNGQQCLSQSSSGMCVGPAGPQGPVVPTQTQPRVQSQ